MKLVFTRNELVTMVKTTMSIPGLMKKFLTDDYIINTFETKMLELTKKTTVVSCDKCDDGYVISLDELFVLELISEFGSLVNAVITLTIGAGARMKMVADKYKVKEDHINKDDTAIVHEDIIIDKELDAFMGSNYTVYGTRKNIANILPNIENTALIKHVLVINNKKYHREYYKTRIRHQLDSGYIDGLVLIDGAVYALYANREGTNNISIHNIEAYDLGIIIDDKHLLGEVNNDDIMILKSVAIVEPKDIYYLFFNIIDDIKNFLLENKLGYKRSKQDVVENMTHDTTTRQDTYSIYKNSFDIKSELSKSLISNDFNIAPINSLLVSNNNTLDIELYNSCKIDIPLDDDLVLEALIICGLDVLGAVVRNLKSDNRYIRGFWFDNGYIYINKSHEITFKTYPIESIYIDHIDNKVDKRYYLFFTTMEKVKEFYENNTFNIPYTKPVDEKVVTFHDLDISLASHTFLAKNNVIPAEDYNKYKTGLIRGTRHIDGLIFHGGKIYEIRTVPRHIGMGIWLLTNSVDTRVGSINLDTSDEIHNYVINIDGIDSYIDMWIVFFNNLDNMHLFLDKNFKL